MFNRSVIKSSIDDNFEKSQKWNTFYAKDAYEGEEVLVGITWTK
jgi:hypothetical protein